MIHAVKHNAQPPLLPQLQVRHPLWYDVAPNFTWKNSMGLTEDRTQDSQVDSRVSTPLGHPSQRYLQIKTTSNVISKYESRFFFFFCFKTEK
ncbi:hypothetical protein Btru_069730 [Bulinus truncatus]|nr:hypothetical protein Btru_069730 [Bulinus truncatus]